VGKNRYSKALKILKSTEVDEKINALNFKEDAPTNSVLGVYSKPSYIDVDQLEVQYSQQYWNGGDNFGSNLSSDFSQDYLDWDSSGTDTTGLIGEDGTVFSQLPPGSEHFILGPIVDGFVSNESGTYTNIGYIQKDTRQFVILAKIDGQWQENMNGSYPIWNGTENGLTIYNQNFTLEMAQWVKENISKGNYRQNVPYFYGGSGVKKLDRLNSPPNMKGGNAIAPNESPDSNVFTRDQIVDVDSRINSILSSASSPTDIEYNMGEMCAGMSINQMQQTIKMLHSKLGSIKK